MNPVTAPRRPEDAPQDVFAALAAARPQEPSPELTEVSEVLKQANPVAQMSAEEYLSTLRLVVACERSAHGRFKTKTSIELAAWLDVLEGRSTAQAFRARFATPFSLGALAQLRISPLVAFVYLRMAAEAW